MPRRPAPRLLVAAAVLTVGACTVPSTAPEGPARLAGPRGDQSTPPSAPKDSTLTPKDSTGADSGYQNPVG